MEPGADPRKRSAALTEGHRWPLFGMFILISVASSVLAVVIVAIVGNESFLARVMLLVVDTALTSSFQAVLYGCAYYALRVAKEGVDIEQLAAVFD
jgi:multisubunit Na+/H+ antiporter MnhG subunit